MQLMQDDFVTMVQETLEFLELAPEHLELEITESMLMKSFQILAPKLEQLRKMGVRIALDDFGTGYSSLSYLSQIPITTLKLEKSFIDKIDTEQEGLTDGILYLCKQLNLNTVAEGVEKNSQVSYLKRMGCRRMQGYLFSKPLPEQGILDLLKSAPTLSDDPYPRQAQKPVNEQYRRTSNQSETSIENNKNRQSSQNSTNKQSNISKQKGNQKQ